LSTLFEAKCTDQEGNFPGGTDHTHLARQLGGDAQGVADLRLARPELTERLRDRLGHDEGLCEWGESSR